MGTKTKKTATVRIKRDDTVMVIAGNHNGKSGKVLEVYPREQRVVIEGINVVTKHIKPSAAKPEGGIEKTEAPLHISNVMLVDPANGEPTRVGRKADSDGKMKRYSKKTGEFIK